MKAVNKGFTLIELMIVVAVIGVLAAIAIPQYQNYVAKSELAAAYATVSAMKVNYEDYIANNSEAPADATAIGGPTLDATVGTIEVNGPEISYAFGTKSSAKIGSSASLAITKSDTGWACTVTGAADTSIPLPKGCSTGSSSGGEDNKG